MGAFYAREEKAKFCGGTRPGMFEEQQGVSVAGVKRTVWRVKWGIRLLRVQ